MCVYIVYNESVVYIFYYAVAAIVVPQNVKNCESRVKPRKKSV